MITFPSWPLWSQNHLMKVTSWDGLILIQVQFQFTEDRHRSRRNFAKNITTCFYKLRTSLQNTGVIMMNIAVVQIKINGASLCCNYFLRNLCTPLALSSIDSSYFYEHLNIYLLYNTKYNKSQQCRSLVVLEFWIRLKSKARLYTCATLSLCDRAQTLHC